MVLVTTAACATNPVTGKRQLSLVSEAQEIEMGRQAAQEVGQQLGLVEDKELQSYVQRVGRELAARSQRPKLPWSFAVVDDATPNAFALPGGFIFVTRGMMSLMDSEAELASVLGHEIGHVTARHSVTQISRQQVAQLGLGLGGVLLPEIQPFGQAIGTGLQLLFLKHGRDAEREADKLGFDYARVNGYDLNEFADVFASLQRMGEREQQGRLPSWLSTHPAPAERVETARKRLASLGQGSGSGRTARDAYLQRIDGMVYGDNPRNGFFRQNVFHHPDMRFRMTFPDGWRTANMAQAVVGVSGQQNAAIQLTLAGDMSAAEATRKLMSQQGIQAERSERETFNGIPAVITLFQAQTEQGVIGGYAAFLEHQGRTYQIVAYSPAQVFEQYDDVFRRTLSSFAPETDPQVLNVEPQRIDIVRTPRAEPLSAFNRSNPSSVPIEMLAILNQVPQPSTTLPAGTLVKRVVGEDVVGEMARRR